MRDLLTPPDAPPPPTASGLDEGRFSLTQLNIDLRVRQGVGYLHMGGSQSRALIAAHYRPHEANSIWSCVN